MQYIYAVEWFTMSKCCQAHFRFILCWILSYYFSCCLLRILFIVAKFFTTPHSVMWLHVGSWDTVLGRPALEDGWHTWVSIPRNTSWRQSSQASPRSPKLPLDVVSCCGHFHQATRLEENPMKGIKDWKVLIQLVNIYFSSYSFKIVPECLWRKKRTRERQQEPVFWELLF